MNSKVPVLSSDKSDALFNDSLAGIQESNNNLPQVSAKDKKGGKLTKTMAPLLDKSIESAPLLEKHLPREFTIQNMVDNKAASKKNQTKISALLREVKRLVDNETCIGIQLAKDYRIVYDASKKAAIEDDSLTPLRDQLGAPFQKKGMSEEKKAEKAEKAAKIAVEKAAKATARAATKKV